MSQEENKKQNSIDSELNKSSDSSKDTKKSHGEILKQQITEGLEIYDRRTSSIMLSSITAGLEIGFSYLLICSVFSYFSAFYPDETLYRLISLVYPVGFILVILGQSILFTEQTSLLTLPVLNKKRSLLGLMKIWGLVISGNLIGGYIISLVLLWIGPRLGIFQVEIAGKIALHISQYSSWIILASAILAGWLMGLLSWLITSSSETMSRIVIIFIITATMSFTGLHHSIIGNVEMFSGLISSPEIKWIHYFKFQFFALLGNAIGGAFFVALLKYRAFVYNIEIQ